MKKAAFIDRDGTILSNDDFLLALDDYDPIKQSFEGIKLLCEKGYFPVIITNQSGVARGYYDENFQISSDYDFIIRLFKNENLKVYFLNEFTIKMKIGGKSNKNIENIITKMKEDYSIMKKHNLSPLKTIFLKNISKISQFF